MGAGIMAIVKVSELQGAALDWAVKQAIGAIDEPGHIVQFPEWYPSSWMMGVYRPSRDWDHAGILIKKCNVMLSPPTSAVHRNYGYMDKRNGYEEAGFWGTTIFAKERKHRRAAFHHKHDPLIPAMQAVVQFELGDEIDVPDELIDSVS